LVLIGYTSAGLDLAPATAVRTGRALVAYCRALSLDGERLIATAQAYGGKLLAELEAPLPAVACVMPGAFPEESGRAAGSPERIALPPPGSLSALKSRV